MDLLFDQIEYFQSQRARCIRITVKPGPKVIVIIPRRGTLQQAKEFVSRKKRWIQKTVERLAKNHPDDVISPSQKSAVTDEMIKQQGLLFDRLRELAAKHGFCYCNAGIRNQKTRWGSCSSRNHISLNIHLLNLPEHLRDYVILHELVHTEHKNHSKRFWARLEEVMEGKSREYRKQMRQYRIVG